MDDTAALHRLTCHGPPLDPAEREPLVLDRPRLRVGEHSVIEVAAAASVAGALSGVPSTVHGLLTGRSPLVAARAAGELLGRPSVARGVLAHGAVSLWWTVVLARVLPRRHRMLWGTVAGLVIAALDLSIARWRYPTIAALPTAGQLADHVAFGALAATMLARRGSGPSRPPRDG